MPDLGNTSVFNQTDGSNASGTMPSWSGSAAPSTLDDAGRALQGAVTREWTWRNYTLTAGGSANAKTLTYSVTPAAYYDGQRFAFIANTTNTSTVNLNVNGLGAKAVKKLVSGTLTDLASGDMPVGTFVEVAYNSSNNVFVWVNQLVSLPQGLATTDTPQFAGIEVGNASDTTLTRSAAGVLAVEGKPIIAATGTAAQGDVLYYDGTAWVRLGAGTSGQYFKTNGAAANPAWATLPGSMTLLATLATTSGSTASASGLTLTNYKSLYISIEGVSFTGSAALKMSGVTISDVSGSASGNLYGYYTVNLLDAAGTFTGAASASTTPVSYSSASASTFAYHGKSGITTASTSVDFSSGGTFDAGQIRIYGIA